MEEAVSDVNEGVLVHVGVPDSVGSHVVVVVVEGNVVVVGLVVRHDLWISCLTLHTLTPDSRSAWLLTAQEARRRCTLHAAHTVGQNQQFSLLTDPDSLQPVT